MEIVLKNVSIAKRNQRLDNLNITIPDNSIIGIIGEGKTLLLELLDGNIDNKGSISFNGKKRTKENFSKLKKEIGFVTKNIEDDITFTTVLEYMNFLVKYYHLSIKNPDKKIADSLKIVGLDSTYLTKNIKSLSSSESRLIQIAICLLSNPKVILFDEPMINLDMKNQKRLLKLMKLLKDKYKKSIIIASHDSDLLYQITDYLIILSNNTCIREGVTTDLFEDVPFLLENNIELPDLVNFTYKVLKEKQVKLSYHKDIRDLIKDIYKHVDIR